MARKFPHREQTAPRIRTLPVMSASAFRKGSLWLVCTLLMAGSIRGQFHNGLDMTFGQQRVQYRTFDWQYLGGHPFEVQFYQGGRKLAEHALFSLLADLCPPARRTSVRLGDIHVLVYNKHADFRQSNIGIDGTDAGNIGGTTTIHGRKVFAWFDGDRAAFRRQLRSGLNRVLLRQFLYGEDWKDVVKNAQLYELPAWMEDGMVGALTGPMAAEDVPRLEDLLRRDGIRSVQVLDQEEARIAGEAVWHFILETFGRQSVVDVLSGFKAGRTLDAGFRRIGFDLEGILAAAQAHHLLRDVAPAALAAATQPDPSGQLENPTANRAPQQLGDVPHRARRKYDYPGLPPQPTAGGPPGRRTSADRSGSGCPTATASGAWPATTTSSSALSTPPTRCSRGTPPLRSWPTSTKRRGESS